MSKLFKFRVCFVNLDLQSWDDDVARCDLEKELDDFAAEMKSIGDVAVSGEYCNNTLTILRQCGVL